MADRPTIHDEGLEKELDFKYSTYDCETDPFKYLRAPRPFLWGCYDGSSYHEFGDTASFIAYVKEQDTVFYAHNGGKFDAMFFIQLYAEGELRIINNRVAEFKVGKATFRDSYSLYAEPLKSFNKTEIDYGKLEADVREQHMDEISAYLKSDCVNLHILLFHYFKEFGNSITHASNGWKRWKQIEKIKPSKTSKEYFDFFKPFYFGGRVECFTKGYFKRDIFSADIVSSYPYAMTAKHAFGGQYMETTTLPKNPESALIIVEADSLGQFPLRVKEKGVEKLVFPNDRVRRQFCVTGWEFMAGLETVNAHMKITRVYEFLQTIDFKKYIGYYFDMKKASKKGEINYTLAKLGMNSLYGKFAQDPAKYKKYVIGNLSQSDFWEKQGYSMTYDLYPRVVWSRPLRENEQFYNDIVTGASITGFARARLQRALARAKRPYYCDTDAVHAEEIKEDMGSGLGQWEIEFAAKEAAYYAKKVYALRDNQGRFKKASKGAKLTGEDIFNLVQGKVDKIVWQKDAPSMSLGGIKWIEREFFALTKNQG